MHSKYSPRGNSHAIWNRISNDRWLQLSLAVNLLCFLTWLRTFAGSSDTSMMIRGDERTWHGGHPIAKDHKGSCWCGAEDNYCMCTPNVAIDLVLVSQSTESNNEEDIFVWLVKRKDTDQLAVMGGFVDVEETVEHAVHRELKEEMGIVLESNAGTSNEQLQLQGVYSDPKRDNRRRNVSVVFVVQLSHQVQPKAADDVKDVKKIPLKDIEQYEYFADHKTILLDYRQSLQTGKKVPATTSTLQKDLNGSKLRDAQMAVDIQRSVCS